MITIIALILGALAGTGAGYIIRTRIAAKNLEGAEAKAEAVIKKAQTAEQEMLLAARDKALKITEEAKRDEESRRREIKEEKAHLEKRESLFDAKLLEIEGKQTKLAEKVAQVEKVKTDIDALHEQELVKLSEITKLSKEDAEAQLLARVETSCKEALVSRLRKLQLQSSEEMETKAKNLLAMVVQRQATTHLSEFTTSTVEIPSDEMKGRIIGKEGRNIKAIERLTGTDIIVDESPGIITVSAFSPIRRQIAKIALLNLIKDGRIHPTRIEEAVTEAKRDLAADVKKAGEDALYQMGIAGIDPKLVAILGRLKYRTSYGQNVLVHSMEVANCATLLATELGADIAVCRKGGLLHDIGKAVDHDVKGTHPELGYELMKKYGLSEEIAYMSIAHHEDAPKTLEGVIVKVADALSGARPGARRESLDDYVKRLEDLEKVCMSFQGVEKAYAIQAGREVRVFVVPQEVDDLQAYDLAKNIAQKIESEMAYPGEVKVNVIRETRIVEYAR